MISVRYPARDADAYPAAPQMLPGEAAGFAALNNFTDVLGDEVDWSATRTHAHEGAPIERDDGRIRSSATHPVSRTRVPWAARSATTWPPGAMSW